MIVDSSGKVVDGLPASPFRSDQASQGRISTSPVFLVRGGGGASSGHPSRLPRRRSRGRSLITGVAIPRIYPARNQRRRTVPLHRAQPLVSVFANYRITAAPTNFTAVAQNGKALLTWDSMSAVHYRIQRAVSPNGPYTTIASELFVTTVYPMVSSPTL